jgi:site-specific DNA-methyltransferase (adenine-specific)
MGAVDAVVVDRAGVRMMYHDDLLTLYLGDCVEVMAGMEPESIDAIVTDPPYGLEFMGKEWDRFATGRGAKYAKGGSLITEEQIAERRGKGGAGPSYVNRPAKRCAKCGKQAWSGSPCRCEEPEWVMDNSPLHAAQAWHEAWAREAYRISKPGAHLLAFGGTRTYHRLASAIEDAGWEIRDCLVWAYASGFPKSLDVSKAIDKAAGAERERTGNITARHSQRAQNKQTMNQFSSADHDPVTGLMYETAPATPDAAKWDGWGTALKPAWEPIVMARKPLRGTVARNVQEFGTGALNIDATRIGTDAGWSYPNGRGGEGWHGRESLGQNLTEPMAATAGRWPANLILTDPIFDGGVDGVVGGGSADSSPYPDDWQRKPGLVYGGLGGPAPGGYGDSGTYSRFFTIPESGTMCEWCGASPAESSSSRRSERDGSAPDPAPTEGSSDGTTPTDSPTTSATEQTSWHGGSGSTSRNAPSPGSQRGRPSHSARARSADLNGTSSATTTTTPSRWMCDSCAADAMRFFMAEQEFAERRYPWAFLIPKAARSDREPLVGGLLPIVEQNAVGPTTVTATDWDDPEQKRYERHSRRANIHPTVKPVELMRHLVRLVTPPGGTVLDCFLGSGTTAIAANMEGFACIGIEREAEYLEIAKARILHQKVGMGI